MSIEPKVWKTVEIEYPVKISIFKWVCFLKTELLKVNFLMLVWSFFSQQSSPKIHRLPSKIFSHAAFYRQLLRVVCGGWLTMNETSLKAFDASPRYGNLFMLSRNIQKNRFVQPASELTCSFAESKFKWKQTFFSGGKFMESRRDWRKIIYWNEWNDNRSREQTFCGGKKKNILIRSKY